MMTLEGIVLLIAGAVCIGIIVWLFWPRPSNPGDSERDTER